MADRDCVSSDIRLLSAGSEAPGPFSLLRLNTKCQNRVDRISGVNTNFLLAVAALLITNSHLENFYPWPLLAGDGLLGNSMFFMVAGLGITLSARRNLRPFGQYYWRRIKRIYPAVLIVVTAFLLIPQRGWNTWGWRTFVANYIWPTPWAFIEFVMVLYVIFYLLLKLNSARVFLWMFFAAFIPFGLSWYLYPQPGSRLALGLLHTSIWWVFWFQMMSLGGYVALRQPHTGSRATGLMALIIIATAVYIVLKILFVTGRVSRFHFFLFPIVALIVYLVAGIAALPSLNSFLTTNATVSAPIKWIGSRTLEIYVLQGFLAYRKDLAQGLAFPINIALFLSILAVLVWVLHRLVAIASPRRQF